MDKRFAVLLAGVALYCSSVAWAGSTDHANKHVALLSSPTTTKDCVYFTLAGVTEADPQVPGASWFAVPETHLGFKEIVSFLALAKASDRPITVRTSNSTACGYIVVEYVYLL